MGNYCCVIHGSSSTMTVWADEDEWGPNNGPIEKEGLLDGCGESSSAIRTTGNQVRIRISRKELEEVLKRVDHDKSGTQVKKLKGHHVLQKLIDKSDHFEINNQRPWTPALQSIPELN